jgi:hypothetical protein
LVPKALPSSGSGIQQTWVWDISTPSTIITSAGPQGNGRLTNFCIHVDHPALTVNEYLTKLQQPVLQSKSNLLEA